MTKNQLRVLHVVESVGTNAVESWLRRMFAHGKARGDNLDWTFYCQLTETGSQAKQVEALGGRVIPSPVPLSDKSGFAAALRRELTRGRYDVMHAHHDILNGYYFAASVGCPVLRRICHIHNADEHVPVRAGVSADMLRGLLRRTTYMLADQIVGISDHTLDRFLRYKPRKVGRDHVHYYGVDPSMFAGLEAASRLLRDEIQIPAKAQIMLFGGRLVHEKNPLLAVDIFAELYTREPDLYFVVAGTGGLSEEVARRLELRGVSGRVRMLGWRDDLPRIMGASDLFVLARPEEPPEGFGLAIVEAQLAGLRLLLSNGIPDDPLLPSATVQRLAVAEPVTAWADAAQRLLHSPRPTRSRAFEELKASPMDMDSALDELISIHCGVL